MWFNARAKLTEIVGQPPDTIATTATKADNPAPHVAKVASVATPLRQNPKTAKGPNAEAFPYGTACNLGDSPLTYTGRVVSLDEWRRLTEWERHGPNGRHWNGITKQWGKPT